MHALFNALITSKMRIRILVRLFLNPGQHAYLRGLAEEFGASTSQVREELRNLSEAGLLDCKKDGRQINYRANPAHPLFPELQSMVRKSLGMDRIIESILERLGDLETAILIDDYAAGKGVWLTRSSGNVLIKPLDSSAFVPDAALPPASMQADASRIACTDLGGSFPTPLYHGSAELAERPASMQASSPIRKQAAPSPI